MIQLPLANFSALKRAASSPTSGLLLYSITWIAESTNANWNARPYWTKRFMAMQLGWKGKLQVFHSCSSAPKVVEHQIVLCFRWDGPSSPAKLQERDLPTSKRTIYWASSLSENKQDKNWTLLQLPARWWAQEMKMVTDCSPATNSWRLSRSRATFPIWHLSVGSKAATPPKVSPMTKSQKLKWILATWGEKFLKTSNLPIPSASNTTIYVNWWLKPNCQIRGFMISASQNMRPLWNPHRWCKGKKESSLPQSNWTVFKAVQLLLAIIRYISFSFCIMWYHIQNFKA